MIVMTCSAVLSVSAAVFIAVKSASKVPVKISELPATRADRAKEMNELAAALIKELDRIQKNSKNTNDLVYVVRGIQSIIRASWRLNSYYGTRGPTSFLKILHSSSQLEADSPSKGYIELLKDIIKDIIPICTSMVLSGEDGNEVTTVTYNGNRQLETAASRLDQHVQAKLRKTFNEQMKEEGRKW